MDASGSAGQCINGCTSVSVNGCTNGRTNGCVLPWMTRWVWDNSISWEETSWNRIDAKVGYPSAVDVQGERVRGNVRIRKDINGKEIYVTPGDRLSSWWVWKEGQGWYYSKDGGVTYQHSLKPRPLSVVVLVISAVVSCLGE